MPIIINDIIAVILVFFLSLADCSLSAKIGNREGMKFFGLSGSFLASSGLISGNTGL